MKQAATRKLDLEVKQLEEQRNILMTESERRKDCNRQGGIEEKRIHFHKGRLNAGSGLVIPDLFFYNTVNFASIDLNAYNICIAI